METVFIILMTKNVIISSREWNIELYTWFVVKFVFNIAQLRLIFGQGELEYDNL